MPVTQRGSSWQAQVNHQGQRYRRNFETKRDAQAWEADSKGRLLRGEPVDMGEGGRRDAGKPYTLKELVDHVQSTHWDAMPSGRTTALQLKSLLAHLGPTTPIHKLGKGEIDRARQKLLADGNQPGTVNRKVALLSKAFTEAVEMNIIPIKPKFAKYKEAEHRIRRFTEAEERRAVAFYEARGSQDMADFIVLSVDTGLRQGEMLRARFEDVWDGRISVWGQGQDDQRTKSSRSRTVPLTDRAKAILARHQTTTGLIFADLDRRAVQHQWSLLREALDMETDKQFVPHIMRHEFCSRLADNGATAPEIMALAGHSSLTVSQKYIHLNGANLDKAIARLNTPSPVVGMDLAGIEQRFLAALPREQLVALLQSALAKDSQP